MLTLAHAYTHSHSHTHIPSQNGSPRDQSDDDDDDDSMATSPPHGGGGGVRVGGGVDKGNESFSEPELDEPEELGGPDRTGLMLYDFEGEWRWREKDR